MDLDRVIELQITSCPKYYFKKLFQEKKEGLACFVDFSKAYDTIWRNGLLYKLIKNGLSYKFISLIKSMYEDIKMAVKLPGGLTPFFESLVGLRQGCNLSPMLFNIYVNDLIEELQNDDCDPVIINNCSISCLMYADDLLVLSESWEGLTASLNKLGTFSNKWKLTVSENKTKIMVFSKNGRQPFLKHKVGNITIKTCNEYTYLGTTFTQSNSFKVARKQLQKKASKAMFTFLRHINTREGAKPKTIIKLFNSLVKPILIYNSENYLISDCLYECYKDLYSADSSVNKNWLKAVIYLFESNAFQLSNLTDYLELDQQTVLKKAKQNLCKIYEEYSFEAVKDSNRLSPIDNNIKSAYKEDEYLSETIYHKYRSAITKFKISAHCFPIEYGRWTKIEHNNRVCQICFMGGLGNFIISVNTKILV